MPDTYRMLRVIEYEGPLDWVLSCMEGRHVKGTWVVEAQTGKTIREAMLGETPTLIHEAQLIEQDQD